MSCLYEVRDELNPAQCDRLATWLSRKATGGEEGFDELSVSRHDVDRDWTPDTRHRLWLIAFAADQRAAGFLSIRMELQAATALITFHIDPDEVPDDQWYALRSEMDMVLADAAGERQLLAWSTQMHGSNEGARREAAANESLLKNLGFVRQDEALIWRRSGLSSSSPTIDTARFRLTSFSGSLSAGTRALLEQLLRNIHSEAMIQPSVRDELVRSALDNRHTQRITVMAHRENGSHSDATGVAVLLPTSSGINAWYHALTYVAPTARRQGLAGVMKREAIRIADAVAVGAPVYSWTDTANDSINAVNRGLGYSLVGQQCVWVRR